MKDMMIDGTRKTPQVDFRVSGDLKIEGRSFVVDPRMFFEPLFEWIKELDSDHIHLDVRFDYINTGSTKLMNEFIKLIDANPKIPTKTITWYYEEDDEDMLEIGQVLEENTLSTQFFFKEMDMAS